MRTLLICHDGADLERYGISRWLASFSDLCGIVVIKENNQRMAKRIKREVKRVGLLRFFDVLAFRTYYKFALAKKDLKWEGSRLYQISEQYPALAPNLPILITHSPNSSEAEKFIGELKPDIMIARCKTLLAERIFTLAETGTFVMHPGICPEYRNAHGCFWALAERDTENVGMTLLKIDKGIDTGPVYGYFKYDHDELNESHIVIQHRVVFDNLDSIQRKLINIYNGKAETIQTTGRRSGTWGQPWMSKYLKWKRAARSGSISTQ